MTPLTVPEARAILAADEALKLLFDGSAAGKVLGIDEGEAWIKLVESAAARVTSYEVSSSDASSSGSESAGPRRACRACHDAPLLRGDRCRACGRSSG